MESVVRTYWLGEGCLNTFVVFDLLQVPDRYDEDFLREAHAILLAEQRDDALILLPVREEPSSLQLKMIVLEPDASIAAFCGNGARVIAAYLNQCYHPPYEHFSLLAPDGVHRLFVRDHGLYGVDMLETRTNPAASVFLSDQAKARFEQIPQKELWRMPMAFSGRELSLHFTETAEPHLIMFEQLGTGELTALGSYLNAERRDLFPKGININQVQRLNDASIQVVTYERGVNRITKACGTGSTSSAVFCHYLQILPAADIEVHTPGGRLIIEYSSQTNQSIMTGPAAISGPIVPDAPRRPSNLET